ncbi:xanthine dehydrogenase YagR molybdenum-binding subunit [Saccharopolyspora erythraea NRRL 2338]|uniref:Aldehyde oxidase and xanthine dehydrogenase, a/b hammerhead n=2 Tax=Saccharopolyspora erythraea TaxID=1836 RepID=A4FIL2_SACEN|nr:xanthine dehydrogenase family protein molybdopterin-binding subunit [Saccharopolyspora erythraea]EQD87843.1 carbon monoxide dehydrogenase [Saccharopolyspora erythraea D]PFG97563.1 xanthine dehydrogenase YagR molybdenum-binding subunit [Saccharopolyspora erythraea NRRL 2338]QRK87733.1 xanthine dehydrogenase family protein molybdopterin-binding subunit [Saccharopolyspora erythraea]CAM03887.1 aldehyde oxidase and xanthine dehydrogenase, a/b hammerhead [Saccharopolyspora erythraea NRRL 2338]
MTSRLDGPAKVTGQARYGVDHNLPGMVHGYVLLSTIAHGEIAAMDVAEAERAPGVLGVFTPFNPLELRTPSSPLFGETWVPLQDKEVAYYGQPIGFVVAETYEQARDAAMLVEVSYHQRPALTSLEDGLDSAEDAPADRGGSPPSLTVLADGVESIEDALASSPVVFEATYSTATQNHAAMEPHSAVAVWDSGGLTVYSGNQGAHLQAAELAGAFDVDPSSVHAVNPYVGGAFGGKARTSAPAFLAAAAAKALDRPVKAALSREQVFTATATRPATVQKIALGARTDGTLVALRHDSWCSTPMDRSFVEPTSHGTSREWYATENLAISQKMVPLNIPPTTFMRAPGEAPGSFALESAIDELAVELGMDPIELRMRNNSTAPPGKDLQWSSKHLDECFRLGAERFGWASRSPRGRTDGDWLVGLGTATAMFPALRFPATVEVTLRADDTAVVATSGSDPGTGLLTVLSLVGGESLDIAPERVAPRLGDSALPPGGLSGGSTATASVGSAIMIAATEVIDELVALASSPGAPFEGMEVTYEDGRVLAGDRSMTFGELLRAVDRSSLAATGSSAPGEELTKHSFSSFGAQFCEVRVHRWTREARVSRMLGVFDAGRIINEKAARSQLMGGMIWGVSAALHEGLEIEENGRLANGDFAGYLVPVNADISDVDVHFVQYPDTLHNSVGAKGVGEIGTVGMAAAVANAIHNATGVRVRHIPIVLEDLLEQ